LFVVRRIALAIIVALLTFSASGVVSLVRAEPCTANEPAGSDDSNCPPACVREPLSPSRSRR
jgi:hypothetical protein